MTLSTRDFVMQNEMNVQRSGSSWYGDNSPDCTSRNMKMEGRCSMGKSWADRMDDYQNGEARKRLHLSGKREANQTDQDKENSPTANKYVVKPLETDKRKLQTRQRQIDIGKETVGYKRYMREVRRKDRTQDHPRTPNKYTVCSTRSWQGTVRVWRRKLHYWDTPEEQRVQQQKFANILTSPYMFDEDNSNDEEETSKSRRIDNSIDNDDCISEGSSQNSSEGNDSNILADDAHTESVLFWSGI